MASDAKPEEEVKQDFRIDLAQKVGCSCRKCLHGKPSDALRRRARWHEAPVLLRLTACANGSQRFLYRTKDIEGVDRPALQQNIQEIIFTEGELGGMNGHRVEHTPLSQFLSTAPLIADGVCVCSAGRSGAVRQRQDFNLSQTHSTSIRHTTFMSRSFRVDLRLLWHVL